MDTHEFLSGPGIPDTIGGKMVRHALRYRESANRSSDFLVQWNTTWLKNGRYQVLGLMHVFVKKADADVAVAGQNIVDVIVEN